MLTWGAAATSPVRSGKRPAAAVVVEAPSSSVTSSLPATTPVSVRGRLLLLLLRLRGAVAALVSWERRGAPAAAAAVFRPLRRAASPARRLLALPEAVAALLKGSCKDATAAASRGGRRVGRRRIPRRRRQCIRRGHRRSVVRLLFRPPAAVRAPWAIAASTAGLAASKEAGSHRVTPAVAAKAYWRRKEGSRALGSQRRRCHSRSAPSSASSREHCNIPLCT